MRIPSIALALAALVTSCSSVDTSNDTIQTRTLDYSEAGTPLTGYLALPANASGDVPGVLVVHEWWGHNEYAQRRARDLAELGYAALALDMYGDGKLAEHPTDATEFMNAVMGDSELMRARFEAALDLLHAQPGVDAERTGAIGYCMGGGIVLAMARAGVDLDAVASFHGSLGAAMEGGPGETSTRALVCTGADDPFVPAEAVTAFEAAWPKGATLRIETYEGAKHSFTNPGATAIGEQFGIPLVYDAEADAKSWEAMKRLFAETF